VSIRLQGADVIEGERKMTHDIFRERHHLVMLAQSLADYIQFMKNRPDVLEVLLGIGSPDASIAVSLLGMMESDLTEWDAKLFEVSQ